MAFRPANINYSPTEQLRCLIKIEHILFPKNYKPGDWAIFAASVEEVYEGDPYSTEIKVKGRAYSLDIGGLYQLSGTIDDHPEHGFSYNIVSFVKELSNEDGDHRRLYLESIFTEKQVEALYRTLPDPYKTIQDGDLKTLCTVKGIGKSIGRKMIAKFQDDFIKSRAYVALGKYDLSITLIDGLIKRFHGDIDKLLYTINKNPYIMMFEIDGIGWKKADQIAFAKGIKNDDPIRFEANIIHQLNQITEQGNTWVTPSWLISAVLTDMGLSFDYADRFRECLYSLHEKKELWWDEDKTKIALYRLRKMEENIAKELYRIAGGAPLEPRTQETPEEILKSFEIETGFEFTEEQRMAITSTLQNNVSIITGGAGTGKSTSVRGVLKVLENYSFAQCALSGRAAARLSEVTGQEGRTIHRLLQYKDGVFTHNADNPLPYDIIILDEISMVGAEIFLDLLKAIGDHTKLIMLGDEGQLESIGLCNLFKDMLDSSVVPVSRLTKIHRQAAKSAIITESVKVRNKEPLIDYDWVGEETRGELQDLKLVVYDDGILSQDTVVEQYEQLIKSGIDYNDIQIVLPMKQRGMLCTYALNQRIQEIINPPRNGDAGILVGATKNDKSHAYYLRRNDRVIVTKNMYQAQKHVPWSEPVFNEPNYDTSLEELYDSGEYVYHGGNEDDLTCPVYNGDRGIITEIDSQGMIVNFDQWGEIYLKREDFRNVELGYALSCHKLQGSEAAYVIVGLDMSGRILLTKEWLYTAITRAKKHCIVCAESRALSYAVNNSNISIKQTMLKDLLIETFEGEI